MPKPAKKKKPPKGLHPYLFHGVELHQQEGVEETPGACPVCERDDGRFSVNARTGQAQCLHGSCDTQFNVHSFLKWLWETSDDQTTDYRELAEDRGLLKPDTLMRWRVSRSILTGDWLLPGYDASGKLVQLYRYSNGVLLVTPTMSHGLFGIPPFDRDKPVVYLCEGPWDAMALWEVLKQAKETERGIASTASMERSLLTEANVLAVPGCNVFKSEWCSLFAGKLVCLLYDSDHPKRDPRTKKMLQPAGLAGMRRVTKILMGSGKPPDEVRYIRWPEDTSRPSGFDVRDLLRS